MRPGAALGLTWTLFSFSWLFVEPVPSRADANGGFRTRLKNGNEGCEREPRVWRYHRWDSFTCAKMKEGIVVGCLLKVSAMASDDEGFALSVTSKLREFMALGYPAHVLNGVIGRAFARTKDERLLRARQCSQW